MVQARKQNVTVRLSIQQIESLVGTEEACENTQRVALDLMDQGFHLGGTPATRDKLHARL